MMSDILIVGLGNPGKRFSKTRHNLGDRVVQFWRHKNNQTNNGVRTYEPSVYMNESGRAVLKLAEQQAIPTSHVLMVHDDTELSFGKIKFKEFGSAGGHNGVRSIQAAFGTDKIARLRLGIGRPGPNMTLDNYVLQEFTATEEEALPAILATAEKNISELVATWRQLLG